MDGWPGIPKTNSGKSSPSRTSTSLPAPGSTVVANVEDDLGDGMYSLRWAGQRINVSSRTPLKQGQALLLKSETSPEGKPRLVVLGPAPQQPQITGRVIYGPGHSRQHAAQQESEQQYAASQNTPKPAPPPSSRPQGVIINTNSDAAGSAAQSAPSQTGGQMAAGVAKANAVAAPEQMQSMVGLILEPLPDARSATKILLLEAQKEKAVLQNEKEDDASAAGEDGAADAAEDGENAAGPEKAARPETARPTARPAQDVQGARPGETAPGGQPPRGDSGQGSVGGPAAGLSSRPAVPETGNVAPPPVSGGDGPARPEAAPAPQDSVRPPAMGESVPARPETGAAPPQAGGAQSVARPPAFTEGGPAVPEMAGRPVPGQETPAPAVPPSLPVAGGVESGNVPQALPAGDTVSAPNNSPHSPTNPSMPSSPVVPQPLPGVLPGASLPASGTDAGSGAAVPEPPPSGVAAQPAPAPGGTGHASLPGTPSGTVQPPSPGIVPDGGLSVADAANPPASAVSPEAGMSAGNAGAAIDRAPSEPSARPVVPPPAEVPASPPPAGSGEAKGPQDAAAPALAGDGRPQPAPDAAAPAPQRPGTSIYPRPGTAAYARPAPQANHDGAAAAARDGAQSPPPEIKPEMLFREALSQMVKAAEFPMGAPSADAESLGVSNRMPEAVLDKAAAILLRGAGLTPEPAAMEAAKALVANNVQVDRDAVQALLAVTAGVEDAAERTLLLKAAARLSAKDIPLSPPLVAGLADVLARKAGVQELMAGAMEALTPDPGLPEAVPLMAGAKELLDLLHVDLDRSDAAVALERYVSTFGREALGKALALVETSAQTLLENNPLLQKIDQTLTLLLTQLQGDMEEFAGAGGQDGGKPLPAAVPGAEVVADPETADVPPPASTAQTPVFMRPGSPIHAYLNAPRALPIEEMLKNLPPMPKVVSLGTPPPAIAPGQTANVGGVQPPAPPPAAVPPADAAVAAEDDAADPAQLFARPGEQKGAEEKPESGVLMKLDRLFQTPGLNRPELELLRPGGLLERYLDSAPAGRDGGGKTGAEAAKLLRELLSDNPAESAKAQQELPKKEAAVLREAASRLTKMESEAVRADPVLNRLADAAASLRDLGRQLLAAKAENLAGQDRNPGVVLAEVPFKLNDDAGDGRMQMFYRRSKGKADGWTSRVILDLNTTRMGPVLGDMRFFGQDMVLNMFVEDQGTAEYLAASEEYLADALWAKGFRLKSKFMVLPPPAPPPSLDTERPAITNEHSPTPGSSRRGRLDIET